MTQEAFRAWVERERSRGLIGLHVTVCRALGITPNKVLAELLESEEALARGDVRPAPRATSQVPEHIAAFARRLTA